MDDDTIDELIVKLHSYKPSQLLYLIGSGTMEPDTQRLLASLFIASNYGLLFDTLTDDGIPLTADELIDHAQYLVRLELIDKDGTTTSAETGFARIHQDGRSN
jgi:hypothetical protein